MRGSAGSISLLILCLLGFLICGPSPCAEPKEDLDSMSQPDFLDLRGKFLAAPHLKDQVFRQESLILETDRDPLDVVIRRTRALLNHLQSNPATRDLSEEARMLAELEEQNASTLMTHPKKRAEILEEVRKLRRRIAFANPLLDFDKIVFLKHRKALGNDQVGRVNHMCDQYYGFCADPGGGLYVLENPFSEEPKVRDVLADSTVENGRLEGQKLEDGSFISLDLSYDAQTLLFAWTEAEQSLYEWTPKSTYHIFQVGVDGSNLIQLTGGIWNEFDPCYLPGGRIAFISERRGGYLRCGKRLNPTYTLHSMDPNGTDIIRLSYHETHEWHPSVDNNGMIVYTRWDYVDRDSDIAHHIWTTYPDGRDPRTFHGNYPIVRESRPWMEMSIRAIPNSHKYVAVSTPHHGQAYGTLVMIDQQIEDDRSLSQLKRITPETHFPESEISPGIPAVEGVRRSDFTQAAEVYANPWPLSEDFYLCVYDADAKNYGIYLVDTFGNRELLYRDSNVPCLDPIPLKPRPKPPVLPTMTRQAASDRGKVMETTGTIAVMNVYDSLLKWPEGTEIKGLRIVQIFPKTTPAAAEPNIGVGDQSLARGVLGTVPVEEDGSAYFVAPAGVPFYFQALDERGMAVQSMRSDTYVHAGETLTCQGCHEDKHRFQTEVVRSPLALERPPSRIQPDVEGSNPLLYPQLVQGVLDRNCVSCHETEGAINLGTQVVGKYGWTQSYESLAPFVWTRYGGNGTGLERNGSSRSIPGQVGARASHLFHLLEEGHYDVQLSKEDLYRLTLWMDCNSTFYGSYHETEKQAQGVAVAPILE
ncbi:MAG: hypothetical protein H6751_14800 [Candidatus Omnitrophica bacterium]|nr:hypothetical protein [Candidatus Omnitrophota bacterium]